MVVRPFHGDSGGKVCIALLRFRYLLLLAAIFTVSFLFSTICNGTDIIFINTDQATTTIRYEDPIDTRFTIHTEGCSIPGLQPFDPSILKFIEYPSSINPCPNKSQPLLLDRNCSHIWINLENLQDFKTFYNLTNTTNISCCYKPFFRPNFVSDITSFDVDNRVKYGECTYFEDQIKAIDEFVRVICSTENNKTINDQFFVFAISKELKTYYDQMPVQNKTSAYNVIVLGIDSVSRLNFYRTMNKTSTYLKNRGAIELLGYNKVGDNTFPNIIPILLGMRDTDLNKTCWFHSHSVFDNCPFVWELYKSQGFYTAFAEDFAYLATFNYGKAGFIGSPTNYYYYTFQYEAETIADENQEFCMGGKYFYRILLDYIDDLTTALRSSKLFGFFWETSLTHDDLNYPMVMDDSYTMLLENLENKGYLEDTILFVMSDHGMRWGDLRETKQGRLEERLPLLLMLTPPSFRRKYTRAYDNLETNSQRLITPFDIHETLADLTNPNFLLDENIKIKTSGPYAKNRGISLFLPVPANRTCAMAGIEDHWCTCHRGVSVPVESKDASEAAANIVMQLNKLVWSHKECAQLWLDKVISVMEMMVGKPEKGETGWREFLVQLRTMPGGGVFEGTLRSYEGATWELAGSISRLNLYGKQSKCIHDFRLKLYCYCRGQ